MIDCIGWNCDRRVLPFFALSQFGCWSPDFRVYNVVYMASVPQAPSTVTEKGWPWHWDGSYIIYALVYLRTYIFGLYVVPFDFSRSGSACPSRFGLLESSNVYLGLSYPSAATSRTSLYHSWGLWYAWLWQWLFFGKSWGRLFHLLARYRPL